MCKKSIEDRRESFVHRNRIAWKLARSFAVIGILVRQFLPNSVFYFLEVRRTRAKIRIILDVDVSLCFVWTKKKKNESNHRVTLIAPCKEGITLRRCIIFFFHKPLRRILRFFLARSTRNRDSIQQWISDRTRSFFFFFIYLVNYLQSILIENYK